MSEKLRRLAEAATPGPWQSVGQVLGAGKHRIGDTQDVCCFGHSGQECDDDEMEQWAGADAAYIAAASPDVILAMLDERNQLREAARDYLAHDGSGIGRTDEWRGDYDAMDLSAARDRLRVVLNDPVPAAVGRT